MSKEFKRDKTLDHLKQQLERWEKEGYDVSDFKAKWHKEIYERKPSRNKPIIILSLVVCLVIIIAIGTALGVYYGTDRGGGATVIPSLTPTPTSTPAPELTYNGTNEDWQEAIAWINNNTPYPHNVLLQFTSSGASTFMTAPDESSASAVIDELGYRYIAIDYDTAWPKYHTMITWSGKNESDFYEYWYRESNGELRCYENPDPSLTPELQTFYPAIYQSMCARLYNFGTEAVVPNNSTWVISYVEKATANGERYKLLTDVANNQKPFATYEEAAAFINDHPGYVIVGTNPFVSPIPLEALKEYKLIHSSPFPVVQGENTNTHYVEIFEYTGYAQ